MKSRFLSTLSLAVLALLALPASVDAKVYVWEMVASEDQVNNSGVGDGSTDSAATGSSTISYDTKTKKLTYDIQWSGLEGLLSAIHVHGPADPGSSTMPHLFNVFTAESDVISSGVDRTTGSVQDTAKLRALVLDTRSPFDPGQALRFMLEDRGYVNIHSSMWPMGEIRADLVLVQGNLKTTSSHHRCSRTIHEAFDAVSKRTDKEVAYCIDEFAAGNTTDLEDCFDSDSRGKLAKASNAAQSDIADDCGGFDSKGFSQYPFIASPDEGKDRETPAGPDEGIEAVVVSEATEQAGDLIGGLFGDPDDALVTRAEDDVAATCQADVWKRLRKCHQALIEEHSTCVRKGFPGGKTNKLYDGAADPFAADADVEGCLGFDRKGAIADACADAGAWAAIEATCGATDLETAFPGVAPGDIDALAAGVLDTVRCAACEALNEADGMDVDCDLFDNDSDDDSCEDD